MESFCHQLRHRLALLVTLILLIIISVWPDCCAGCAARSRRPRCSVWPEYDDPGVLVILVGDFANDATFPQKVDISRSERRAEHPGDRE